MEYAPKDSYYSVLNTILDSIPSDLFLILNEQKIRVTQEAEKLNIRINFEPKSYHRQIKVFFPTDLMNDTFKHIFSNMLKYCVSDSINIDISYKITQDKNGQNTITLVIQYTGTETDRKSTTGGLNKCGEELEIFEGKLTYSDDPHSDPFKVTITLLLY